MTDLTKLMELMAVKGIARRSELVGVSQTELQALEEFFGLVFPKAYRNYLRQFGRSAGYLSPWMAIYFDDLKEIKESFLEQSAALRNPLRLPAKSLLIAQRESVFDLILCKGHSDPVVFRLNLAQPKVIRRVANSFSQYLHNMITSAAADSGVEEFATDDYLLPAEDRIRF